MRRVTLAAVVLLSLVIPLAPPAVDAATVPLGQRIKVGAWAPPAPWQGLAQVEALESTLERPLDIVHFFETWETPWDRFYRQALEDAGAGGRTALLTWEPWAPGGSTTQTKYTLASITRGEHDANLRAWAEGLREHGAVVHLRPMHEMNGNWYPWSGVENGNTPEEYVAAWRHMHDLFRAQGATNVRWVWSPNALDVPSGNRMEAYYPGQGYVDVIGLDGYNWGGAMPSHGGWQSFDEIFDDAYRRVTALGPHPVWLAEVAADEAGGDKAGWIRDMLGSSGYPRIEAIVWFNEAKERDWRIESSATSAAAFREGLRPPATAPTSGDPAEEPSSTPSEPPSDEPAPGESVSPREPAVVRLSGTDRFDTAAAVAIGTGSADGIALVASGDAFPDALAAASLAGVLEAPVLLTPRTRLHPAASDALNRLGIREVVLVGGAGAVDPAVETALGALVGRENVRRIAGPSRYETAAGLARAAAANARPPVVLLASGDAFPDALAAGALAAGERLPLLLTSGPRLPDVTRQALEALTPTTVAIVGGAATVPVSVEEELDRAGHETIRLAGPTRTATAAALAAYAEQRFGWQPAGAVIARGDAFPDALAAGPYAGRLRVPLLLTSSRDTLGPDARGWLQEQACTAAAIDLLGGTAALSTAVESAVRDALTAAECSS